MALSVVTKFRRPARSEFFWAVGRAERLRLCAELVSTAGRAVVFCRTMPDAIRVASELSRIGVPAASVEHRDFASSRVRVRVVTDETALSCGRASTRCVIQFDPAATGRRYRRRVDLVAHQGATIVSFVVPEREADVRRLLRSLDLPDVLTGPDLPAAAEALAASAAAPDLDDPEHAAADHDRVTRQALATARAVVSQVPKGASWAAHQVGRVRSIRRTDGVADAEVPDDDAADDDAADDANG